MVKEQALLLGRHGSLVGIYTCAPSAGTANGSNMAVVLFNAGLIHHVGPHRLYVKLARVLAAQGISTLRFDLSGIGDSSPRPDFLTARELAVAEPREIFDELVRRGHDSFVLCGICSGARTAKQASIGDPRVKGLILINPASDAEDPGLFAQTAARFYLSRSIWRPRAWFNLFTGRVNYTMLFKGLAGMFRRMFTRGDRSLRDQSETARRNLETLVQQGPRVLALLSDRYAQAFNILDDKLDDLQRSGRLQIEVFPDADHLFTSLKDQNDLVQPIGRWAKLLSDAAKDERYAKRHRLSPVD